MNMLRKIVSVCLVFLFAFGFSVTALAITLSGTYNCYYYTCTATLSASRVYGKLTYTTTAPLKVSVDVVAVDSNGEGSYGYTLHSPGVAPSTPATMDCYYSSLQNAPTGGHFASADYTYKIGATVIETWSL